MAPTFEITVEQTRLVHYTIEAASEDEAVRAYRQRPSELHEAGAEDREIIVVGARELR